MARRLSHEASAHKVDPLIPIMNLVCMLIPLHFKRPETDAILGRLSEIDNFLKKEDS